MIIAQVHQIDAYRDDIRCRYLLQPSGRALQDADPLKNTTLSGPETGILSENTPSIAGDGVVAISPHRGMQLDNIEALKKPTKEYKKCGVALQVRVKAFVAPQCTSSCTVCFLNLMGAKLYQYSAVRWLPLVVKATVQYYQGLISGVTCILFSVCTIWCCGTTIKRFHGRSWLPHAGHQKKTNKCEMRS